MTKGQEIGNVYAIGHRWDECASAIDAAIAEAVSKRTVACAEDVRTELRAFDETGLADRCYNLCLALNTPPAPAYPFGKDATGRQCACWEQNDRLWWNKDGDYPHDLDAHFTHCPFCGAPRTKGD